MAIASPNNKNNWECALSEAAFMTGLERNAAVVHMTSYAPLMAHSEGWQWTPDLLWFNNLEAYGTPNYYVQKLFATNSGTDLISILENGKKLIGQNNLYASAAKDMEKGELIIKLVNTSAHGQETSMVVKGSKLSHTGQTITLKSEVLSKENSFESPKAISPTTQEISSSKGKIELLLPQYSLTVLKFKLH